MDLTMAAWGCCCYSRPKWPGVNPVLRSFELAQTRGSRDGVQVWMGMGRLRSRWHSRRDGVRVGSVGFDLGGLVVGFGHRQGRRVRWESTSRGQGRDRDSKGGRCARARCSV